MKVSFDFDDTLQTSMDRPNAEMVHKFLGHMDKGDDIIIVTSRKTSKESMREIQSFLNDNGLKVSSIHHTDGDFKAPLLDKLGVDVHYDDDPEELKQIAELAPHIEAIDAFTGQAKDDWDEYTRDL